VTCDNVRPCDLQKNRVLCKQAFTLTISTYSAFYSIEHWPNLKSVPIFVLSGLANKSCGRYAERRERFYRNWKTNGPRQPRSLETQHVEVGPVQQTNLRVYRRWQNEIKVAKNRHRFVFLTWITSDLLNVLKQAVLTQITWKIVSKARQKIVNCSFSRFSKHTFTLLQIGKRMTINYTTQLCLWK
jgi:hypothetical protein